MTTPSARKKIKPRSTQSQALHQPGIKLGKADGRPGLSLLEGLRGIDQVDDEVEVHGVQVVLLHPHQCHQLVLGNDQGKHQVLHGIGT